MVQTRAEPLGIEVIVGDEAAFDFAEKVFAVLLQYPDTTGAILDYAPFIERAHAAGALAIVAADILALTLLRPPGEFGADIAVGSTQRFGVPLGFGGPHAALHGGEGCLQAPDAGPARRRVARTRTASRRYRLSLQTREQHIRRDKATSNICTAQVLLAVMASMYAVYHGPDGLRRIARRVHLLARLLAAGLTAARASTSRSEPFFDTVARASADRATRGEVLAAAQQRGINLRAFRRSRMLRIALDETTDTDDVRTSSRGRQQSSRRRRAGPRI